MNEPLTEQPWYDVIVIPALLRHARAVYGSAMRTALADIDCNDIPKNGLWIIGGLGMEADAVPLEQLGEELGLSDEGVKRLIEALVGRGYLEREADPGHPNSRYTLTARGRTAAAAQAAAREHIDAQLISRVGPECVAQMRKALGALCAMRRDPRSA